jgi:hypothetical protein
MGTDWCWDLLPSIMDTIGLKDERRYQTFQARSKRYRIEMEIKKQVTPRTEIIKLERGKTRG